MQTNLFQLISPKASKRFTPMKLQFKRYKYNVLGELLPHMQKWNWYERRSTNFIRKNMGVWGLAPIKSKKIAIGNKKPNANNSEFTSKSYLR